MYVRAYVCVCVCVCRFFAWRAWDKEERNCSWVAWKGTEWGSDSTSVLELRIWNGFLKAAVTGPLHTNFLGKEAVCVY